MENIIGKTPRAYTLKRGDTLSKLARDYYGDINLWPGIFNYNVEVQKVLGPDPNLVHEGTAIILPRSRAGYEQTIIKMQKILINFQNDAFKIESNLTRQYDEHKAFSKGLDLTADIATFAASASIKLAAVHRADRVLKAATGAQKVAAQYLKDKSSKALNDFVKDKLRDSVVDWYVENNRPEYSQTVKDARAINKGIKMARSTSMMKRPSDFRFINKNSFLSNLNRKSLLDISELLVDMLTPSKVANFWLLCIHGETTDQTYAMEKNKLNQSVAQTNSVIMNRINVLRQELKTVWGEL